MGKTSFNNPSELINNLSDKITDLNSGKLSLSDLDLLVADSQSLYEQLIILRYKAFDTLGEPLKKEAPIKEEPISIQPELPKNEPIDLAEIPFDFSGITHVHEPTIEAEPAKIESIVEQPIIPAAPLTKISKTENDEEEEDDQTMSNSLNDTLKKEEDQSLRKIFQNSPISDIKSQISIGKKFEYISSMFKGNAAEYEDAIDFLNTAANGNEAKLKLNELTHKYSWDLEDKSIIKFIELVERRYL